MTEFEKRIMVATQYFYALAPNGVIHHWFHSNAYTTYMCNLNY